VKTLKRRKTAIDTLLDTTYNLTVNHKIALYLETYIDCEIGAQKLIRFYKKDNGKLPPKTLFLPNIIKAATYFDFPFDRDSIVRLFPGGEGRRGRKSPRQLRNAYVHAKRKRDSEEMLLNYDTHMALMRRFIDALRTTFQ